MAEVMEDDEQLGVLEAHLNGYADISRRWRGGGMDRMEDEVGMDPNVMGDGIWWCVFVCRYRAYAGSFVIHSRPSPSKRLCL